MPVTQSVLRETGSEERKRGGDHWSMMSARRRPWLAAKGREGTTVDTESRCTLECVGDFLLFWRVLFLVWLRLNGACSTEGGSGLSDDVRPLLSLVLQRLGFGEVQELWSLYLGSRQARAISGVLVQAQPRALLSPERSAAMASTRPCSAASIISCVRSLFSASVSHIPTPTWPCEPASTGGEYLHSLTASQQCTRHVVISSSFQCSLSFGPETYWSSSCPGIMNDMLQGK